MHNVNYWWDEPGKFPCMFLSYHYHREINYREICYLLLQCPMSILVSTKLIIHGPVTQPVVIGNFRLHVHMVVMRNVPWRFGCFVFVIKMEKQSFVIANLILMMKTAKATEIWSHFLHCVISKFIIKSRNEIRGQLQSFPICTTTSRFIAFHGKVLLSTSCALYINSIHSSLA